MGYLFIAIFLPPLVVNNQRQLLRKKYEINFAASKHSVNEHVNECFIFQEEEAGNKKAFFEMLLLTPIMQYFRMTEAALQVD